MEEQKASLALVRWQPELANPLPWRMSTEEEGFIEDAFGRFVGTTLNQWWDPSKNMQAVRRLANARRIIACVNACAGVETSLLETMRVIALGEKDAVASYQEAIEEKPEPTFSVIA